MAGRKTGVLGKLVAVNVINDEECIATNKQGLYTDLIENIGVEIPGGQNDTFISVGVTPPSDKTKVWLAVERSGTPIALRKFITDKWVDLWGFGLPYVVELLGDPNTPPEGFKALDGTGGTPNTKSSWVTIDSTTFIYKAIFTGA